MTSNIHQFHIPVMGTGHSIDTPIRVGPFGIASVISLVDDILIERIREYYCRETGRTFQHIPYTAHDGRAKRITAYLNLLKDIVEEKFLKICSESVFEASDKRKYFEMLPPDSPLRKEYQHLLRLPPGEERDSLERNLTGLMRPGSIDVNIMVKLDSETFMQEGPVPREYLSDAKAALRGYAESALESSIIFSAGINQPLFTYLSSFPSFYRDSSGKLRKKIVLKVSDYRSALTQGKFLARKGLEVSEFRVESGLNCGGHAFPSDGSLLPSLLKEFSESSHKLAPIFLPMIMKYYKANGMIYPESDEPHVPLLTVQGGIGNNGEVLRLTKYFGMAQTGWASPFLLVPEATCVDRTSRELLAKAGEKDLYVSHISPMGVPFNNVRGSGLEKWTRKRIAENKPGSPCPKKYLTFNTEFSEKPLCLASARFQQLKVQQIKESSLSESEKQTQIQNTLDKMCICNNLGSGILIELDLAKEDNSPQCVCPGPNIAWFDRFYSLQEMVDHIYGRGPSLVPEHRPHMFAQEIRVYVDYFEKELENCNRAVQEQKSLENFKNNLETGIALCLEIAETPPYPGENLESIKSVAREQHKRLAAVFSKFMARVKALEKSEQNAHPACGSGSSA